MRKILRNFWADRAGNYAMMTVVMMLPLMGALTIGVDYAEMSRQRQLALNALDAAGIGTARRFLEGTLTDAQLKTYAEDFFKANYGGQDASRVKLTLVLPDDNTEGGNSLKLSAAMTYQPYFLPVLRALLGNKSIDEVKFNETTEVRLKNTLEVAMALDNSASMLEKGGASNKVRMDLLKAAAKQLVDTLAKQGNAMKAVAKPVQFSLVPFAASVNVGPTYATEAWMDRDGIAPSHHENFDWSRMAAANPNKRIELVAGVYTKQGTAWPAAERGSKVTRFSLFNDIKRISGYTSSGAAILASYATWEGCVEARPSPYNNDDTTPTATIPATLFQPMFAPDETDREHPYNDWWGDVLSDTGNDADLKRQKYTPKYFTPILSSAELKTGPNQSCTTKAITPLTEVTNATGLAAIKTAIDNMQPDGGTNVPEGMAWGWRTVSSAEPFTQGRSEAERGNDKVMIVVTDGANTYYPPGTLSDGQYFTDGAGNKSIYSAYAYGITNRIFTGTGVAVDYTKASYTAALNANFKTLCDNAKAKRIMVMTVAVDLDANVTAEKDQIAMLKACSSDSRFRKDASGNPVKLFWNSTGASLEKDFEAIGNELSNLRIII